jgi:hypothetical protein
MNLVQTIPRNLFRVNFIIIFSLTSTYTSVVLSFRIFYYNFVHFSSLPCVLYALLPPVILHFIILTKFVEKCNFWSVLRTIFSALLTNTLNLCYTINVRNQLVILYFNVILCTDIITQVPVFTISKNWNYLYISRCYVFRPLIIGHHKVTHTYDLPSNVNIGQW